MPRVLPGEVMRRFFIAPGTVANGCATLYEDLYRHMAKVLRLKAGEQVLLADGAGHEFIGVIRDIGKDSLLVTIQEAQAVPLVAGPAITLYQGLPKGDKLDFVLQKATELGVAEIVPFVAERSVARVRESEAAAKVARWKRVSQEAARQSGRSSVPKISFAGGMEAVGRMAGHSVTFLLWEEEREKGLKEVLAGQTVPASIGVVIGPEGGLTPEEAATARRNGFIPVSLGRRILRTETAALAVLAILQFHWGDLG